MQFPGTALLLGGALLCAATVATPAAAAVVHSNNPAPGDSFTNPGGTNQGQAIGSSGWFYNNTRNGGVVGISDALPRSGNGSVSFASPSGAAKADIEFLANGANFGGNYAATGSLGSFADLAAMSYDWYRSSASTTAAHLHPSLRVLLDADGNLATTGDRGGLVFERAYNGNGTNPVPTDIWLTDLITSQTKLWNFGLGLGFEYDIDGDGTPYDTLAEWQAGLPNAVILGFSSGVGSGWGGTFIGAVDNIAWTIGSTTTSTNFEVQAVPEPGALALFGLALAGLAAGARRRAG